MKNFVYIFVVVFISSSCNKQLFMRKADTFSSFDWQGHRGARGVMPENTLPAFLYALTNPEVKTLELDVVITKDQQVVVSHEPWISATICQLPNGDSIKTQQEKELSILNLNLTEVQAFDCGSKFHPGFPEQQKIAINKPSLQEVIAASEMEALRLKRPLPYYNIEIKSHPEWDNIYTPTPEIFAQLVLQAIEKTGVSEERVIIQSFDIRSLEAVHELAEQTTLAYLVYEKGSAADHLKKLSFKPAIFSPYYELVTTEMIESLHQSGIKVIPWTVNESEEMQRLRKMGVDGIITDYPNRIPPLSILTETN